MRWVQVIFLSALGLWGASAFAAGPEPASEDAFASQDLVTLPPRDAPFDAEKLARIRASLGGLSPSDSEGANETKGGH